MCILAMRESNLQVNEYPIFNFNGIPWNPSTEMKYTGALTHYAKVNAEI